MFVLHGVLNNKTLTQYNWIIYHRGRKLNIVFITKLYFAVPKFIRLDCTGYFIIKNFKQTRVSKNKKILTLKILLTLQKHCTTILFFSEWCYSYIS